ncbi:MAG TPA: 23S rRNA (uracil(1939)-C(5))-methyltransferase RlmD [Terracidiphilus sp.]|jgi:23S rRNA (uracil1939-C5)-methyltransferase
MKRVKPHAGKPRPGRPIHSRPSRTALVEIEKPIYGGAFLSRLDGKATFIPLTLPAEQVQVRIVEEKRSYVAAEPEQIITPSPNRIAARCPHFGLCGGCSYQHANYQAQIELKQEILRETLARAGVAAPEKIDALSAESWTYRNRIRLAFDAAGRLGYRGRRSHQIIPIRECPISAPSLVNAAMAAAEILSALRNRLMPTEISLFCDAAETALLSTITVQRFTRDAFDTFAASWKKRAPSLAGIELVRESHEGKEPTTVARWGESSIAYHAAGFDYQVENGAFFQVNRWLIDDLVHRVVGSRTGTLAWDLFAGVGLFARPLTQRFEKVVAVESAPVATHSLTCNLQGRNAETVTTDTLSFLRGHRESRTPDLIVVDPPRAGLGPEITALLSEVAAPALVYASCDPSTLARDLKALVTSGYSLASVTLVDLFPQTFHLETLVELCRS